MTELTTSFTLTPTQIILDIAGPQLFGGLLLLNLFVVVVALIIVHGLEALIDWRRGRRR